MGNTVLLGRQLHCILESAEERRQLYLFATTSGQAMSTGRSVHERDIHS